MSIPQQTAGAPLARAVLRDGVYERILAMLLGGDLQPGERISIDGLARRLEVSPTPVREALAHLEATGLVTREALRGYRVAPPLTAEQLDQLIDVRLLVETGALDKALKHLPQFADDLRAAHERDLEAVRRHKLTDPATRLTLEQYQEYFEADWGFHRVMLQASHNAYLERVGESLSFQVHRMRQTYQEHVLDAADAVREHEAILDAVSAGDRATALVALQGHLEAVRRRSIAGEQH